MNRLFAYTRHFDFEHLRVHDLPRPIRPLYSPAPVSLSWHQPYVGPAHLSSFIRRFHGFPLFLTPAAYRSEVWSGHVFGASDIIPFYGCEHAHTFPGTHLWVRRIFPVLEENWGWEGRERAKVYMTYSFEDFDKDGIYHV